MLSSWTFFGFFGHLDYNAAATAARQAFDEASFGHQPDDKIGAGLRSWTGFYRDAEPVAFVLNARPWMTWRILAEGITGAQMVVYNGKEFRFAAFVEGMPEAAGFGWMKRTGPSLRIGGVAASNVTDGIWPTDLAGTLEEVAKVKTEASRVNVTAFHDPYVRHDPGMTTTWEYYAFRGTIDSAACQSAWLALNQYVLRKRQLGQLDVPIGRQSVHWPVRSQDGWVDLVVNPDAGMTWRMLGEGVVGGAVVCTNAAKQYQFVLFRGQDTLGVGQITMRSSGVSTNGLTNAR
ncbi:MAG: hypothetical protein Q9176_005980 [Flavoplaca citrina]